VLPTQEREVTYKMGTKEQSVKLAWLMKTTERVDDKAWSRVNGSQQLTDEETL
jgi:hypothetical protein